MPGHLSPRWAGGLTRCLNLPFRRNRSTDQRRHYSCGPSSHLDLLSQNRYTNGHWERQIKFKLRTTNGWSWGGTRTYYQSQKWCHFGGQFWHERLQLGLHQVVWQLACELRQLHWTCITNTQNREKGRVIQDRSWRNFLSQSAIHPSLQAQYHRALHWGVQLNWKTSIKRHYATALGPSIPDTLAPDRHQRSPGHVYAMYLHWCERRRLHIKLEWPPISLTHGR